MEILFVTGNLGKVRELQEILKADVRQLALRLPEVQAINIDDVIKLKAEEAYKQAGKAVLVEDTGLAFDAWKGLPGALIKWFMDTVGSIGICRMLDSEKNRTATAKCTFDLFDGTNHHLFTGEVIGSVPIQPKGEFGFGWDDIFIPVGYQLTFAEMAADEKNNISMRKIAIEKLRVFLENGNI